MALLGLVVALPAAAPSFAQQQSLEVIELRYRSAEEVIPILKPLLVPGGTIGGLQDKLIVKTTPASLAQLRKVLDVIDGAPSRLVISVRQEDSAARSSQDVGVSGRVGTGPDSVQARMHSSRTDQSGSGTQSVQVIEGNAALIRIGAALPVRSRQTTIGPGGAKRRTDTTEYRDADSGFYAQPRVSGDQVTVQLAARRDSVAESSGGTIRIQRVESVISGRLGEWIEVAGITRDEIRDDSGTIYYRSTSGTDRRRTLIRVDRLP